MPPVAAPIDHYENFPVASWLCPAHLRTAVRAVYHFARTADDLADEGPQSSVQRLEDLSEFRSDLIRCVGEPNTVTDTNFNANGKYNPGVNSGTHLSKRWPHVFEPLQTVLFEYSIPPELLHRLLDAFEQDVIYTEAQLGYKTREELLQYCQNSAVPIGRIMMHLFNESDPTQLLQSDAICTALQLINFWQDISIDRARNRFYLPQDSELEEEIKFALELMQNASALCLSVKGRAGWELRAVAQGGLRIAQKLLRINPLHTRPKLTRLDYVLIGWRCLFKDSFGPLSENKPTLNESP